LLAMERSFLKHRMPGRTPGSPSYKACAPASATA
jgi:hypothetical protein